MCSQTVSENDNAESLNDVHMIDKSIKCVSVSRKKKLVKELKN